MSHLFNSVNQKPSLLFLGSSGMLGVNACQQLRKSYEKVYYSGRKNRYSQDPFYSLDVADLEAVRNLLQTLKPDVVIYASGIINKGACERDRVYTQKVHCHSPALIAELLTEWNGKMVYISSDAVYGGVGENFVETDPVNPSTFYAQTKAEGEVACLTKNPTSLCCRVTPVGLTPDLSRGTLAEWAYTELARHDIKGYSNYYFTPISASQLGESLTHALESDLSGVYNIGSQDMVSKYQFIQLMKKRFSQKMTHAVVSSTIPQGESYCAQLNSQKYYKKTGQQPLSIASVIETL